MEKDKGTSKQRVSDFPELAAQWRPTKNSPILPGQVAAGSPKKFWWRCDKGPDHEWETQVNSRTTKGNGCPFCSNRRLSVTNSLAIVNPEIAAQWHPIKNGDVKPFQVTASSGEKIWWKCDKGPDHEWETVVRYRAIRGSGCPFCSNDLGSATNSLESLYPDIAAQWHPSKNGSLTPAQVPVGSAKKYWWKCDKGRDHEWITAVKDRTAQSTECPFCDGKKPSKTTSLEYLFPSISAQWHPTKNNARTPDGITAGSHLKVWWKCDEGPDHEWEAVIKSRTLQGAGCPSCYNRQASVTKSLFVLNPELAAQWHPTKNGDLTSDRVPAGSTKEY